MSFFSITGESGNFQYTVGHDRIPDNWYKRAIDVEYTIPGFLADVVDFGEKYPPLLSTGGNTGKPGRCFLFRNVSEYLRLCLKTSVNFPSRNFHTRRHRIPH
jgi:hypothetical protein